MNGIPLIEFEHDTSRWHTTTTQSFEWMQKVPCRDFAVGIPHAYEGYVFHLNTDR